MGKTLWQRWMDKLNPPPPEKPVEEMVYNPLELKIGSSLTIDELDWRDLHFFVQEIKEYKRNANTDTFTDYVVRAQPMGKKDVWARIRCFHLRNTPKEALPYQPVLLTLDDEFPYNDDIIPVLNDESGLFHVKDGGVLKETYKRIGGLRESCPCNVTTIAADTNSANTNYITPKAKKVSAYQAVDYWDYSYTSKDEANQDREMYLFVEQDKKSGFFQIWKGFELNPERVVLM